MSHNHCHGHHDHDHSDAEELGIQYNLYQKIDKENLQCLNESVEGSGKTVFKPWDKRLDRSQFVESDADEELLFNIPFTGNVKLKGIKISAEDSDCHPAVLRFITFTSTHNTIAKNQDAPILLHLLFNYISKQVSKPVTSDPEFKNKPNMTFDDVSMEPDQVFQLQKDSAGVLEYSPKIVTFSSVAHLTMHFPSNFGADTTKIDYIGLKGEWQPGHRHGVTICTYEVRPNLDDHKLKNQDSVSRQIE